LPPLRGLVDTKKGTAITARVPSGNPPLLTTQAWNLVLHRFRSTVRSGAIEVPLALAGVVGLAAALDSDSYLSVRVESAGYVPTASRVCLEPLSSDDWEILEANAEHLEGQMLTQVCVACPGQVMPIWVHSTSLIALQVVSAEALDGGAAACVRLTAQTEVAVAPKPRHRRRSREGEEGENHPN
ncbi:unnamed protein product, partial [Hapterophycus canaliculatus]